jgi:hypothetical protein
VYDCSCPIHPVCVLSIIYARRSKQLLSGHTRFCWRYRGQHPANWRKVAGLQIAYHSDFDADQRYPCLVLQPGMELRFLRWSCSLCFSRAK